MVAKKITSLQHSLVKHWVQLREKRTYREETQRVLVSGEKMIKELSVEVLISSEPIPKVKAKEYFIVSEEILKKITGISCKCAAEIVLPPPQDLRSKKNIVILDQIADPGNLGTLLRTMLALGWEGVIVTPGTVDLFNDKALRAAKGATFHLPYAQMTIEEISQLKMSFFTADIDGIPLSSLSFSSPLALILSHEGRGAGDWSKKLSKKVTIPMNTKVESLNVATSGAILLYEMRPK